MVHCIDAVRSDLRSSGHASVPPVLALQGKTSRGALAGRQAARILFRGEDVGKGAKMALLASAERARECGTASRGGYAIAAVGLVVAGSGSLAAGDRVRCARMVRTMAGSCTTARRDRARAEPAALPRMARWGAAGGVPTRPPCRDKPPQPGRSAGKDRGSPQRTPAPWRRQGRVFVHEAVPEPRGRGKRPGQVS
jgi:hypothetical protein